MHGARLIQYNRSVQYYNVLGINKEGEMRYEEGWQLDSRVVFYRWKIAKGLPKSTNYKINAKENSFFAYLKHGFRCILTLFGSEFEFHLMLFKLKEKGPLKVLQTGKSSGARLVDTFSIASGELLSCKIGVGTISILREVITRISSSQLIISVHFHHRTTLLQQ